WTQLVDERTDRSKGMSLSLSGWFYDGLMMQGGVLAINPAYFKLTGGRERWLYRVARKHAGGRGQEGFAIALPTLFEKSGAEGLYRRFKFEILAIVKKDPLPDYHLEIEERGERGEPLLRMVRRKPAATPQKTTPTQTADSIPITVAQPSGFLTEDTLEQARKAYPGWDLHAVHESYKKWLISKGATPPKHYQKAFLGFLRSYHERHKHEL
ncbi:MAG: replication initiator protein A, partial [Pseudomonadota bacterium]